MQDSDVGRALFSVFGILVLGLVVLAVRSSPGLTGVAIGRGAPATVLLLIQAVTGSDDLLPWSSALEACLYFYAAYALIRYMLADHEITRDELWAVGATFTLVAWAFAYTYVVCQAVEPQSFTAAVHAATHAPSCMSVSRGCTASTTPARPTSVAATMDHASRTSVARETAVASATSTRGTPKRTVCAMLSTPS